MCSEMLNLVQHDRGGWKFYHDRRAECYPELDSGSLFIMCSEMLNLVQHDRGLNVILNLFQDLFYFVDKTKQMLLHLFLTFFSVI